MKSIFKKIVALIVCIITLFSLPNNVQAATNAVLTYEDTSTHYKYFEYNPTYILPCGQSMYLEDVNSDSWYLEKGQSMQIICNLDGMVPVRVTALNKDTNSVVYNDVINGRSFAFSIYAFTSGHYQIMLCPTTDLDMWINSYSVQFYYPEVH